MKNQEIILLSDSELKEKISIEKEKLVKLKLQQIVSPVENPMNLKISRKLIARLITEQSNRRNKK